MKAPSQLTHESGGAERGSPQARLSVLLASVAAGDRDGLAALYDETSPIVYGLLRHVLGAGVAADETLVEVYSCVWRRASSYRPEDFSAFTWLVLTTLECVRRRAGSAPIEVTHDEAPLHTETAAAGTGTRPAHMDVEAARAREALRRLDPRQREALRLSYYHGPACLEAALGLSAQEARALVCHGLRSYAETYQGTPADEALPPVVR